jgi:hypothetical protein
VLVVVLMCAQAVLGCASRREAARARLPTADTVCIVLEGVGDPGASFLIRKAKAYLDEDGFRLVDAGCDVTATYTDFNHGEWEILTSTLLGTRSTNAWRAEGVVALRRGATTVVEDEGINIRDQSTMQDLLDELASRIVEKVDTYFRPSTTQRRKGQAE